MITTLVVRREEPGRGRRLRARCAGLIGSVAISFVEPGELDAKKFPKNSKEFKRSNDCQSYDQQVCAHRGRHVRPFPLRFGPGGAVDRHSRSRPSHSTRRSIRRPFNNPAAAATLKATGTKVGTINIEQAIFASNEGQRDFQQLSKKFEPKQAELKNTADELDSLQKQLSAQQDKLNDEARDKLVKQIEAKKKGFDRAQQDAQEDFQGQQGEIGNKILTKMAPLIVKYAADNDYGMILDTSQQWPRGPVIWYGPAVDITQPVVEAYNAQSGVPAPAAGTPAKPSKPAASTGAKPATTSRQLPRHRSSSGDTTGPIFVPAWLEKSFRRKLLPEGRVQCAAFFVFFRWIVISSARASARGVRCFLAWIKFQLPGVCTGKRGPLRRTHDVRQYVPHFGKHLGPVCPSRLDHRRIVHAADIGAELAAAHSAAHRARATTTLDALSERVLAPSAPPAPPSPIGPQHPIGGSEVSGFHVIQPPIIPAGVKPAIDNFAPAAPDVNIIGGAYSTSRYEVGINNSIGQSLTIVPPPLLPPSTRPLPVSHWAEGNLIFRVQPNYPPLARQARIQGTVELRAIISNTGTIENLSVVSGHPMLVRSAVEAVQQWRYRPYLLNGEPIEVETEVTVNFMSREGVRITAPHYEVATGAAGSSAAQRGGRYNRL